MPLVKKLVIENVQKRFLYFHLICIMVSIDINQ